MTEVYFTHWAEADLDEAYGWYAARSLETTGKWLDALAQIVSRLEVSAGRFPAGIENQDFPIEYTSSDIRLRPKGGPPRGIRHSTG